MKTPQFPSSRPDASGVSSPRFGRPLLAAIVSLAALLLAPAASRAQTGAILADTSTYLSAGGSVTFTVNMTYTGFTPAALGVHVDLPAGWSYASTDLTGSGLTSLVSPVFGDTGSAEWAFSAYPANSASYDFTLNYTAGLSGNQTIDGYFNYLDGGLPNAEFTGVTLTPAAVPEVPAAALASGLAVLAVALRRRRTVAA